MYMHTYMISVNVHACMQRARVHAHKNTRAHKRMCTRTRILSCFDVHVHARARTHTHTHTQLLTIELLLLSKDLSFKEPAVHAQTLEVMPQNSKEIHQLSQSPSQSRCACACVGEFVCANACA